MDVCVIILVAESTLHKKHYVMLNHYIFYIILFYNFQCQNWLPWPPTGDPGWNLEAPEWTCVRLKVSGHEFTEFQRCMTKLDNYILFYLWTKIVWVWRYKLLLITSVFIVYLIQYVVFNFRLIIIYEKSKIVFLAIIKQY